MPMQMKGPLATLDRWQPNQCSIAMTLNAIGAKSSLLLLREAFYGTTRFDGFVRRVGVTEAVVAKRLKELVEIGVFAKKPYQEPGVRTRYEYVLTEKGNALLPVLIGLMQWGDKYLQDDGGPLRVVTAADGAPVSVTVREVGADTLEPQDLAVRINR